MSAFFPIALVGLLHGAEPGHGWPLAITMATSHRRRYLYGAWAALILGLGHLVSSFFVVGLYIGFDSAFDFSSDIFRYIAGSILCLVGLKLWFGHSHGHGHVHEHSHLDDEEHIHHDTHDHAASPPASAMGLKALAVSALVLGFAHEEEFALLGFAIGGVNPVALMAVYAVAVLLGLVAVTLLGIAAFLLIQKRVQAVLHYMPRVSALALIAMGIAFLVGLY